MESREKYYEKRVQDIIDLNDITSLHSLSTFLIEGDHSIKNEVPYIQSLLVKKDFTNKLVFKKGWSDE